MEEKSNSLTETKTLTKNRNHNLTANKRIWMMTLYDNVNNSRRFLLATRSKGFFIYDDGTLTPFVTEADEFFKEKKISHGTRLSSGEFAVATLYGGLVILDAQGRVNYYFNKENGLQDNNVKYVFEDLRGNLWLALSRGITRLEYQSPFFHYDHRCGLDGTALTVTRHGSGLYAGTTQGLHVLVPQNERFSPVPRVRTCWDLLSTRDGLLAACANGVYEIASPGSVPRQISKTETFTMTPSLRFPGHVWCGDRRGLAVLAREHNRWTEIYRYPQIQPDIRDAVEGPDRSLWLVSARRDIFRVRFPHRIRRPIVNSYSPGSHPFEGEINLAVIEGHVVFAAGNGLFRFDEKMKKFVPDEVLGKKFAGGPDAKPVFRITQDEKRRVWFHSESRNYRAVPATDGSGFKIHDKPFRRIPVAQVNTIYPEPGGTDTWFAGTPGLIRLDGKQNEDFETGFPALVRRVWVNDDEKNSIFGGYKPLTGSPAIAPVLSYRERDIIFRCAAPFFQEENAARYQYFLEGYSEKWSQWNREPRIRYTNLDADRYTFRVRARNIYGDISREGSFHFRVLPPRYFTWWAFGLYGAVFFLLFHWAVKWRSRQLTREKEKLEQVVKERTREIAEKNGQLERQTVQLRDQSEKLAEMDKIKSRFFANISHEFRTPLTLVMSPLEQLLSKSRDTARKKIYRVMLRNMRRLLTFINQLLDLSRFDAKKMKLHAGSHDITVFLKGILASFRMAAGEKQLALDFHCSSPGISVYFDLEKMEEVMYNLLSNAVKFTPLGGTVTVSVGVEPASPGPGYAVISVTDTGPGIPGGQAGRIFDRFFQASFPGSPYAGGTGIGLALAREIVELHHGHIDVANVDSGGSRFTVRLPLGSGHLPPGDISPKPVKAAAPGENKKIDTLLLPEETEPVKQQEQNSEPVEQKNDVENTTDKETIILVVEDHADMRAHIKEILEPGYTVIEAVDGRSGITRANEFIPDLIISDIMMPGVDGYELCRRLKKDIKTSHIPIILLTARASAESMLRGLGTGADDYVTKPFNRPVLAARVKNLIDLRRQMQKKIQREKMLLPAEVPVSSQDDQFIKDFQAIIEKNLDNPDFDIDDLSRQMIIGRATLSRKVQALTGESPNRFIRSYRLERAARLLKENYGNVTEVAFAVGFSSSQYFATCFKEKFHQSPKDFRATEGKT